MGKTLKYAQHGLPTRGGVGPSCIGLPVGNWPTITEFLVERFPAIARNVWLDRMIQGLVADEFGVAVTPHRVYQGHIRIYYYRALDVEARIPFEETVLFQDEHLVVADKPHFLPVTPSGHYLQETLLVRLKNRLGIDSLTPIHRIDRETAGLVLFSSRVEDRNAYQKLFRQHTIHKHYEAIAPWRRELALPLTRKSRIVEDEPFFRQREVEGEANSESRIELSEFLPDHGGSDVGPLARYTLSPITGKKHQLRVHMNALGVPILNDRMYPPVQQTPDDDFARPLQLLARFVHFVDPVTGQARAFQSRSSLAY